MKTFLSTWNSLILIASVSPLSCYQCTNEKTNIHCVDDFNLRSCDKDTCQTITSYSGKTSTARIYFFLYILRGNKTQNTFFMVHMVFEQHTESTFLRYYGFIRCRIFLYNFSTLKTTYGPHWLNTDLINVIYCSLQKKLHNPLVQFW